MTLESYRRKRRAIKYIEERGDQQLIFDSSLITPYYTPKTLINATDWCPLEHIRENKDGGYFPNQEDSFEIKPTITQSSTMLTLDVRSNNNSVEDKQAQQKFADLFSAPAVQLSESLFSEDTLKISIKLKDKEREHYVVYSLSALKGSLVTHKYKKQMFMFLREEVAKNTTIEFISDSFHLPNSFLPQSGFRRIDNDDWVLYICPGEQNRTVEFVTSQIHESNSRKTCHSILGLSFATFRIKQKGIVYSCILTRFAPVLSTNMAIPLNRPLIYPYETISKTQQFWFEGNLAKDSIKFGEQFLSLWAFYCRFMHSTGIREYVHGCVFKIKKPVLSAIETGDFTLEKSRKTNFYSSAEKSSEKFKIQAALCGYYPSKEAENYVLHILKDSIQLVQKQLAFSLFKHYVLEKHSHDDIDNWEGIDIYLYTDMKAFFKEIGRRQRFNYDTQPSTAVVFPFDSSIVRFSQFQDQLKGAGFIESDSMYQYMLLDTYVFNEIENIPDNPATFPDLKGFFKTDMVGTEVENSFSTTTGDDREKFAHLLESVTAHGTDDTGQDTQVHYVSSYNKTNMRYAAFIKVCAILASDITGISRTHSKLNDNEIILQFIHHFGTAIAGQVDAEKTIMSPKIMVILHCMFMISYYNLDVEYINHPPTDAFDEACSKYPCFSTRAKRKIAGLVESGANLKFLFADFAYNLLSATCNLEEEGLFEPSSKIVNSKIHYSFLGTGLL